ncbi:uncharacterized protein LOC111911893 [Lactuca sativa]|uniref:uncharacterized protein LOC111911893 n=1 Tax=Lactuca sativa TaxID=4236 RepID=UPI000CD9C50E|nr:uncharacterized protein LOC111911893 [Lactuca sativa]
MAKRQVVEAFDRTIQDITGVALPFDGKIMVLGGDFRQVLSVVRRGTRAQYYQQKMIVMELKKQWTEVLFTSQMIWYESDYIISWTILSTKNDSVDAINDYMIDRFHGEERIYYSVNEAIDDKNGFYPLEFLNSISVSGLPPHYLRLKLGCAIISNSCWSICWKMIFLPKIPLCPSDDDMFPIKLKRKQFPIRLCFAMTINKAQGQTTPNVGIYLPDPIFSHGHLYGALSKGVSRCNTKVLVKSNKNSKGDGVYTTNVVYKEVLHD